MAYGMTPCRIDPSITATEAYEQTLGEVPDGFHAVACCGTMHCVRHVTIRRSSPGRFDTPGLPELNPNPSREPWSDERRLKSAQARYREGRNTFKSEASTWQEYCEDYCTSPYTTKNEKKSFCSRHRLRRSLSCLCGGPHKLREPEDECRVFNAMTADEHIKNFPHIDCGRAIVGLPAVTDAQEKASAEASEKDAEAAAYVQASFEVSQAFRTIRVMYDSEPLGSWR